MVATPLSAYTTAVFTESPCASANWSSLLMRVDESVSRAPLVGL